MPGSTGLLTDVLLIKLNNVKEKEMAVLCLTHY